MIYSTLIYMLLILWAIVPFRQIGKVHFYFFLAGIGGDITTYIARIVFHSNTNLFVIIFLFLAFISLFDRDTIIKNKIIIIIVLVSLIFIDLKTSYKMDFILVDILNLVILIAFLTDFILQYTGKRIFSLPLMFLVFYELTVVTKYVSLITEFKNDYSYFISASVFEATIGLFFCIFKEDDTRINIQLK